MSDSKRRNRYLLIPVPPTPNGRLHLGHMAGPYLRMDMLRRSLEQDGHEAELWTGTDSHDSFVLYRAYLSKATPAEVCHKFHPLIETDMRALNIKVDGFVDTLSAEGRQLQEDHAVEAVDLLLASGFASKRSEDILYDEVHQFPVVGTWLAGRCPKCGSQCVGYFCEGCFTHNQPAELRHGESRMPGGTISNRTVESIFLEIPDAAAHLELLEKMRVLPAAIEVVRKMLTPPVRNFRLTVPIDWGLTYEADRYAHSHSIFEVLWELYTYSEMQASRSPGIVPAWRADSDTKVIVACGVDNTIALLMGCVGVYHNLPGAKSPEHIHINYFVNLEGSKFSTNRNHAIWANDLAEICEGHVDGIRLYLARISPEEGSTNFDIDEFVSYYNDFYIHELIGKINAALSRLDTQVQASPAHVAEINTQREQLLEHLAPEHIKVSSAIQIFEQWIASASSSASRSDSISDSTPSTEYWWLKGIALLGYPFAPDLCTRIWHLLGHQGLPSFKDFSDIQEIPEDLPRSVPTPRPVSSSAARKLVGRPL
ncbi:class I tRNA ligase family protein [Undibacterium sp. JH2W]|uniref:class I tRNA ligase family protein n=1 Tax=Undibacterium sp. JH2W TaxID=3413037 RepID=UPI003BF1DFC7